MFYSHTILARKSPLGTVWIAAHLERKIKKPQIDGIDIPSYAECIMFPEVPIALRLSGHLLLGLVRIYSWKVNYLFQDCNRMLTTIRTAFASVQVDLPIDADRAPFEAITLPDTFNLDDLNLDDAIHQIDTPDNHRKTPDQITLAEGEYVMIDIDEDARVEPSAPGRFSCMGPEPTVDETLPPFDIGFEPSNDLHGKSSIEPPLGNMSDKPSSINQTNEAQDPPEIMRKASSEGPELNLSAGANIDPMEVSQDGSPFLRKIITSPITNQALSPVRGSLHGTSTSNVPGITTDDPFEDEPIHIEYQLPEMRIVPSPPQVKDNKRKRMTKVQEKRKRRPKFDNEIVFSNVYMKKQIDGDELCNLVFKRRKLPQTAVDMWKFNRTSQKDMFLLGPLVYGMCTNLHETYERKFPRASDSDAESAAEEGIASAANVGVRDASPERQLTPNSPGNADAPSELPAQKSPGNANARTECQLTPKPPGNADAAQYEDMAPEFPRFSPQDIPSPIRDDDTPFKTPGGIPQSGRGGTGATEIPPADGTYVSPGQMTHDSDPKTSPFPFNDELDGDLPEIPGLISTPGVTSSAGTSATWLGSMSTRTRAVAQYFKDHMPSTTSDDQPGKFSLNRILEGRARKQAARMFFETLVLKSYDYIDVHQEEAYGDIAVSVKPSLSAAKF